MVQAGEQLPSQLGRVGQRVRQKTGPACLPQNSLCIRQITMDRGGGGTSHAVKDLKALYSDGNKVSIGEELLIEVVFD